MVVGALEASGVLNYNFLGTRNILPQPAMVTLPGIDVGRGPFDRFFECGTDCSPLFSRRYEMRPAPSHDIVWWALSLGILAGSSATIFGATAGPVAVTLLEKFSVPNHLNFQGGNTTSFRQFSETGLPLMLIFLSVSSVYVTFLCHYL